MNLTGHTKRGFSSLFVDGLDDFIEVDLGSIVSGLDSEFTLVFSAKKTAPNANQTIYGAYVAGPSTNDRSILWNWETGNNLRFIIRDGASARVWTTSVVPNSGSDNIITLAVSALNNTVEMTANGVVLTLVSSSVVPNPIQDQSFFTPRLFSNSDALGGVVNAFRGDFYHFAAYNRILTSGEISTLNQGFAKHEPNFEINASDLHIQSYTGSNVYSLEDVYSGSTYQTTNVSLNSVES